MGRVRFFSSDYCIEPCLFKCWLCLLSRSCISAVVAAATPPAPTPGPVQEPFIYCVIVVNAASLTAWRADWQKRLLRRRHEGTDNLIWNAAVLHRDELCAGSWRVSCAKGRKPRQAPSERCSLIEDYSWFTFGVQSNKKFTFGVKVWMAVAWPQQQQQHQRDTGSRLNKTAGCNSLRTMSYIILHATSYTI